MWSDTLLQAERIHLVRLAMWATLSILLGASLWLIGRRGRGPLLASFGGQLAAWGALLVALTGAMGASLGMRDHAGAVRLDRMTWLLAGLSAGLAAGGAAVSLVGWLLGRRLGVVGAGLAVLIQGIAVAILSLVLAGSIAR